MVKMTESTRIKTADGGFARYEEVSKMTKRNVTEKEANINKKRIGRPFSPITSNAHMPM